MLTRVKKLAISASYDKQHVCA